MEYSTWTTRAKQTFRDHLHSQASHPERLFRLLRLPGRMAALADHLKLEKQP